MQRLVDHIPPIYYPQQSETAIFLTCSLPTNSAKAAHRQALCDWEAWKGMNAAVVACVRAMPLLYALIHKYGNEAAEKRWTCPK